MKIASPDNSKIKNLKKLKQKKYRKNFGEFLVENLVIISDALKAGYKPMAIFATSNFSAKNRTELEKIIKQSDLNDYWEISDKINKSFSNLEIPSGLTAVYKLPAEKELLFDQSILYLNNISDPGNLGAIFRSAVAFNHSHIILDETCADAYNYKTINAAKDAIFKINIIYDDNLRLLKQLKCQLPIISTATVGAQGLDILKKTNKRCLVFGSESRGVAEKIRQLADSSVKIKMSREMESLNVASAAAIILHYIYNQ